MERDVASSKQLVADQLIACVAEGRPPTQSELFDLASRIWLEGGPSRSAFAWGELPSNSCDQTLALRSAALALNGSDVDSRMRGRP
jgi:hypothetical protein